VRSVCFTVILLTAFISGCAQIPKESVQLSVTLGRDLHEMHRAHKELIIKYFARTKDDINNFIDNKYRPFMLKQSMQKFNLIKKIKAADASGSSPDALFKKASLAVSDHRPVWADFSTGVDDD
jgi:hypothetical protein